MGGGGVGFVQFLLRGNRLLGDEHPETDSDGRLHLRLALHLFDYYGVHIIRSAPPVVTRATAADLMSIASAVVGDYNVSPWPDAAFAVPQCA